MTRIAVSDANSFAIDDALPVPGGPASSSEHARYTSSAAASTWVAMSASMNWRPWKSASREPNCLRSLHVARRELERAAGDAERLRAHERPRAVERAHRVVEAAALVADEVLGGHRALVERDLAGR